MQGEVPTISHQISTQNLFRLTFCPGCDYSLVGLPEEGKCPECGRSYDQQYIVLRGKLKADNANDPSIGKKPIDAWSLLSRFVLLLFFVLLAGRAGNVPFSLAVLVGLSFIASFLEYIAIATSVRRGQVLVWISPNGIYQEPPIRRRSLLGKLVFVTRGTWVVTFLASILYLLNGWGASSQWCSTAALIVWAILAVIFLVRAPQSSSLSSKPVLISWKTFQLVQLEPAGEQFWTLTASRPEVGKLNTNFVNFEFETSDDAALMLKDLLWSYCNCVRFVERKDAAVSGWRKAGLWVGRATR